MPGIAGETPLDLYIMANSPGEIAGLAGPLVRELRLRAGEIRITIVVPPCQYASGEELELGHGIGADRCVNFGGLKNLISESGEKKKTPPKRLLLHLGGDVAFSVYASKKLRCPLWVYTSSPRWRFFVGRYFVSGEKFRKRFV